jgi:hypothetical protein
MIEKDLKGFVVNKNNITPNNIISLELIISHMFDLIIIILKYDN